MVQSHMPVLSVVLAFAIVGCATAEASPSSEPEPSKTTRDPGVSDAPTHPAKQYKSVTIGSQEWMAKNLNVSVFRNGDAIAQVKSTKGWLAAQETKSPAWCYHGNNPKNGKKYGKLYNWYAVRDSRGLCPKGWHVPTDAEWRKLIATFGGMGSAYSKLKAPDSFAARPAGARDFASGAFHASGSITFWWSASANDDWNAWYHAMHFVYRQVGRDNGGMNAGHSVRCVKDKKR